MFDINLGSLWFLIYYFSFCNLKKEKDENNVKYFKYFTQDENDIFDSDITLLQLYNNQC